MDANNATEHSARVAAVAAEWAVRLQTAMSHEERGQFVDWLRESPLHVAHMLRFADIETALAEYSRWDEHRMSESAAAEHSNIVPLHAYSPPSRSIPEARSRKPLKFAALVAASLAAVAVGSIFMWRQSEQTLFSTEAQERREVTLEDGSLVSIAPATALRVSMTRLQRSVMLEHGEALFHVAKDRARPFVVTADHTEVRAVGTAFSVARQANGIVITVAEGRVAVIPKEAPGRAGGSTPAAIALGANEQLKVAASGRVSEPQFVDGKTEFAWANGQLSFENDSVAEVVRRFNVRNRVQIRIADPALAARRVSGVFNASDPDSFALFLQAVAGATVVTGAQEIIVGAAAEHGTSSTAQ